MSKVISLDRGDHGGEFPKSATDGETQLIMRDLSQREGADIITAPTVLARSNEKANIEVIREVISPDINNPNAYITDWTGYKISYHTTRTGFGLVTHSIYNHGVSMGLNDHGSPVIEHYKTSINQFNSDGQTIILPIDDADGKNSYLFITQQEINATGMPVVRK